MVELFRWCVIYIAPTPCYHRGAQFSWAKTCMAISVNDFGKAVVAAGLMSADDVKSLWDGLAPEARPKNADAFGKLLEARGKLTAYQAAELLGGQWPSLVLGDYVMLDKIGAGGMGQVFKAQHRRMKRLVAIKLLPPAMTKDEAAVKRFQREVEAAAKLSHPNIVHGLRRRRAARRLAIWSWNMSKARTCRTSSRARGPLPVAEAVNYITQAARGLAFAHGEGVVHRDIKPANLLLDKKGRSRFSTWAWPGSTMVRTRRCRSGRRRPDAIGPGDGHGRLHGPRASLRHATRRCAGRHLQPGLLAVSLVDRRECLQRRHGDAKVSGPPRKADPFVARKTSGSVRSAGCRLSKDDGQAAGRSLSANVAIGGGFGSVCFSRESTNEPGGFASTSTFCPDSSSGQFALRPKSKTA